jgi:hypothetical protein
MGWNFTSNIDSGRYSGSHHFGSSVTYRYDSEDDFPCDDLIGTWKGVRRDAFYPSYPNAPLGNKYYGIHDGYLLATPNDLRDYYIAVYGHGKVPKQTEIKGILKDATCTLTGCENLKFTSEKITLLVVTWHT